MADVTFTIPDELENFVIEQGYNLDSYIQMQLINPLMERYEEKKKNDHLATVTTQIASDLQDKRGKIKLTVIKPVKPIAPKTPILAETPSIPNPGEIPTPA